ncbi:hypothetical protein C1H46_015023 [Malus baccata]|uniref:Expansin n=1 Tax=Malus baccata TaxID=106549 RepID=A0A540MKP9_MALBA|nr:hypothetical protein C1H46_015023 [Malus baccata]
MPKFANAFALLGESESEDVKELIEVVDERADVSLLEALKKKNAIAKKEADAKKEAKERERLQREIHSPTRELHTWILFVMANSQFVPACIMFIANIVIINVGGAIGGWLNGHVAFYDTNEQGYGVETTALSSALFNNGQTCGACFEVTCVDVPKLCLPGTTKVTATNLCPPSKNASANWCNPPSKHFDLSQPMFLKIAKFAAARIVPTHFQRVPCFERGGIKFYLGVRPNFLLVLVDDVGGAGDVVDVKVKGLSTGWIQMTRNWGQNWQTGGGWDKGRNAYVVGHDWGAVAGWNLSLFRPDRVIGLVNLSVPYFPRSPTTKTTEAIRQIFGEGCHVIQFQEPGRAEKAFARYDYMTVMKKFLLITNNMIAPPDMEFIDYLETQSSLPAWLTEEDIQVFAEKFEESGFTGPLNYYRSMDLTWELLAPWQGSKIMVPVKFMIGDKDFGFKSGGTSEFVQGDEFRSLVPDLEVVIVGGHHFIQQENPQEVSSQILSFLRQHPADQ